MNKSYYTDNIASNHYFLRLPVMLSMFAQNWKYSTNSNEKHFPTIITFTHLIGISLPVLNTKVYLLGYLSNTSRILDARLWME